jgi:hypothetical protein
MIDHLAVDFTEDARPEPVEVRAVQAKDGRGTDLRDALSATDGKYFAMPETGDRADLVFPAPPPRADLRRTVFAKVSGYYDIHLNALGEPRTEVLESIRRQPGFVVRFALEEYQRWKAEAQKSLSLR